MFVQLEDSDTFNKIISVDDAIHLICERYKIPQTIGKMVAPGWSSISTIQTCPKKYFYRYIEKTEISRPIYFSIGALVHFFLSIHYAKKMEKGFVGVTQVTKEQVDQYPDLDTIKTDLLNLNIDAEILLESWRIFEGYKDHYFRDYLIPLAVEYPVINESIKYSSRYDLLASVKENNDLHVSPGTYIIDFKTASTFSSTTLEEWISNGELQGLTLNYFECGLVEKFGPLKGVIVDLIGKQKKNQKFHRVIAPIQENIIQEFRTNLLYWKSEVDKFKKLNVWPKAQANCMGRGFACEYHSEVCW